MARNLLIHIFSNRGLQIFPKKKIIPDCRRNWAAWPVAGFEKIHTYKYTQMTLLQPCSKFYHMKTNLRKSLTYNFNLACYLQSILGAPHVGLLLQSDITRNLNYGPLLDLKCDVPITADIAKSAVGFQELCFTWLKTAPSCPFSIHIGREPGKELWRKDGAGMYISLTECVNSVDSLDHRSP